MHILKSITVNLICVGALFSVPVHAALVTYQITGDITFATGGNDFGVTDVDFITATFTFDDSNIPGGTGSVDYTDFNSSGSGVFIDFPSIDFDETMDNTTMLLEMTGGAFTSFSYAGTNGTTTFSSLANNTFQGSTQVFGNWLPNTFTQVVVPVPAAVWLFGSGLLGLVGVARKKKLT